MMSDLLIAVVGAVVGGVFTVVFGPLVRGRWIEPIQEQKKIVGRVRHALNYYRNVGDDPSDSGYRRAREARDTYRDLSAELRSNLDGLSPYGVFSFLRLVLPKEQVRRAAANLTILASTVYKSPASEDVLKARFEVKKDLKIRA